MKGKTAIVTGAFHGLGLAVARRLAWRGVGLVLHYHTTSEEEVEEVAEQLKEEGAPLVRYGKADFKRPDEVERWFDEVRPIVTEVDYLVNSAGIFLRKPLADTEATDWQQLMAVNVIAPFLCTRMAVAAGVTRIVNILDIAWNKSWRHHAAYAASKAALAALTRSSAVEFAPDVQVNGVAPGLVSVPEEMADMYRPVALRIPMKRHGLPEEVAKVVEQLLESPPYVTGQIVAVDGGLSLRS